MDLKIARAHSHCGWLDETRTSALGNTSHQGQGWASLAWAVLDSERFYCGSVIARARNRPRAAGLCQAQLMMLLLFPVYLRIPRIQMSKIRSWLKLDLLIAIFLNIIKNVRTWSRKFRAVYEFWFHTECSDNGHQ